MKTTTQEQVLTYSVSRASIALAFFAFIMIGANDGAFGIILPSLRTHYQINNATVGLLFFFSTIGYFIGTFNNGLLLEKFGLRYFLMLGGTIILLGMGTYSLLPPFPLVLGASLLVGVGIALIDAGLNSYIAILPNNTALLNYLHAFYGVGAWLGPFVASGLLALSWSWNNVYMLWCGLALVIIAGAGTIFKNQPGGQDVQTEGRRSNVMAVVLRMRVLWLAAFFLIFYVGVEVTLGSWSFSFLTEERHGAELVSGWIVSGYWLGLTLGRLVLGKVGQKVGNPRLIQGCLLGVIVGLLLMWWGSVQPLTAVGLWLTGFCLGPIFPTTIALMSTLVSQRILPAAIGFLASLGSMGAALFPWLAGNLAQQSGLWVLLPYVIVLTMMMLALWLTLQRKSPQTVA